MTQMIREPHLTTIAATSELLERPRTGIVFVPCAICLTPLDLALIAEANQPQLCGQHRSAAHLPLH